jgi:DNA-directed RNA polymerase subunit B
LRELIDAFYRDRTLVNHHIASFNDFLDRRLQNIANDTVIGEDIGERGIINPDIEGYRVKLGKIGVKKPIVKEADASTRLLLPMEARLRDLSYEAPIELEFIPVIDEVEQEPENIYIGSLPIMVKSKACNIAKSTFEEELGHFLADEAYKEQLLKLQEDPLDPGGYFISKGTERVLVSIEDLAPNRILTSYSSTYGKDVIIANVFSQREGYRAFIQVEKKKDDLLIVSLPTLPSPIPLIILLKALGVEKDKEIRDAMVTHSKMEPIVLSNLEQCSEQFSVPNQAEAIAFIGRKVAAGQAKEYRIKRVESLIDRNLLPHLGYQPQDRIKKAIFLAHMAQSILEVALGMRKEDDKDHYANKRLKLAGDLIEDLFRVAFTALGKDLKYQLEREHLRGRELKIKQNIRSDIITQRVEHALATGNWVGGRAGVSQLLDRTNEVATYSHLRRIISPLSRSQPHFEARDLHPTHWGRLCPNETPEGPNCGLVKNLALLVEISEGFPESEVKRRLTELGAEPLSKQLKGAHVYLNGDLIGMHPDPEGLIQKIKAWRRKGLLSNEINIYFDEERKNIAINCDAGRVRRPLLVVKDGKILLKDTHLRALKRGKLSWEDLINEGIVEYVDTEEEENAFVALDEASLTPAHTHMEIDPICILGVSTSLIPYPEYNSSPRNTMGAAMGKQALGFPSANYRMRSDTHGHLLHYPQLPLVQTYPSKYINYASHPTGQNFIVAVMPHQGYNMEDAIVINKGAIERGLARSTFFHTYSAEERRYPGGQEDHFEIPSPECRGVHSEEAYNKLGEDGLIPPETEVASGDVIIGKTSPPRFLQEPMDFLTPQKRREASITVEHGEKGIIDSVMLTESVNGSRVVKIKVRSERIPEIGDKFASKHGQKGVIGAIVPEVDMPFTSNGIVPDLLINPHAIPSRMTIGHVLEMIGGKVGSLEGRSIDGTAFSGEGEKELREALVRNGYKSNGKEVLYDGQTGKKLDGEIFVGCVYYQKLHHMVEGKIHVRSRGPVQILTRQPTEGKARKGGLRFGEMERDCLIAHGASMVIKDRLLDESDLTYQYVCNRCGHIVSIDRHNRPRCRVCGSKAETYLVPMSYAYKLLISELMSLGIAPRIRLEDLK